MDWKGRNAVAIQAWNNNREPSVLLLIRGDLQFLDALGDLQRGVSMSPEEARSVAAILLRLADQIDRGEAAPCPEEPPGSANPS